MDTARTAINPWEWSRSFGYNQGELVTGGNRTLYCSGQTAMSDTGEPLHTNDMAAQLRLSIRNLEAVLSSAGMSLQNLVRLNVYTTRLSSLMPEYGCLLARLGEAGVAPATTLLEVRSLAVEGLMVELEATAVD